MKGESQSSCLLIKGEGGRVWEGCELVFMALYKRGAESGRGGSKSSLLCIKGEGTESLKGESQSS